MNKSQNQSVSSTSYSHKVNRWPLWYFLQTEMDRFAYPQIYFNCTVNPKDLFLTLEMGPFR